MPRIEVDPANCREVDLEPAAEWLRAGKVVAFPTDTLYGLAVDPSSEPAVHALFRLKGRAETSALPLVAASRAQVEAWCRLSDVARRLADEFWPGPLSLICDAPATVVSAVHAGLGSVAIRVPAHPVARALAAAWGAPLTATSANRSGEAPARRADDLLSLMSDALLVLDGGETAGGAPSTIVDVRGRAPLLIREGAVAWNRVLHSLQQR